MKGTHKLLIAILLFCFSARPVKAQQQQQQMAEMVKNSTPQQRAKMQTTMMANKLSLDSVTAAKVYTINLTAATRMDPIIKGDDSGGKFAKMRKMKSIDEQKDKDLKGILTGGQYKQYEAMKEEMKEKMKEKAQEKSGGQTQD